MHTAPTPTTSPSTTTWSYQGTDGPDNWDTVSRACKNTGASMESPIDIRSSELDPPSSDLRPVTLEFKPTQFTLENNGHTIEAVPTDSATDSFTIDGTAYELQQFHFHAASEHHIDGQETAAELHLVATSAGRQAAVLGVLLQVGPASEALSELFSQIPAVQREGSAIPLTQPIDPTALTPAHSESVRYSGSLTTPPCTEGVTWTVFLTPMTLSEEQLRAFTDAYPDDHRPTQPLHGRTVTKIPAP